jgi:hypothetical protein
MFFIILFLSYCITTSPLLHSASNDKVLILTHSFNRPDFIKIQHATFKKFMKNTYKFIVFNDASNEYIKEKIKKTCASLSIECISVPQKIHINRQAPSQRTSDSIQYSLEKIGFNHNGIVMIIDSDMFLIKPLNIKEFMRGIDLYGCIQYRPHDVVYLWNGLVFMKMKTLPNKRTMNFDCGRVNGEPVDSGGQLHHYLQENPSLRLKYYTNTHLNDLPRDLDTLKKLDYDQALAEFIMQTDVHDPYSMELHAENYFLHYRAGGNWTNQPESYHQRRTLILENFLRKILN